MENTAPLCLVMSIKENRKTLKEKIKTKRKILRLKEILKTNKYQN